MKQRPRLTIEYKVNGKTFNRLCASIEKINNLFHEHGHTAFPYKWVSMQRYINLLQKRVYQLIAVNERTYHNPAVFTIHVEATNFVKIIHLIRQLLASFSHNFYERPHPLGRKLFTRMINLEKLFHSSCLDKNSLAYANLKLHRKHPNSYDRRSA